MALITCPECGKEISNKAKECVHCGYPLSDMSKPQKIQLSGAGRHKVVLVEFSRDKFLYTMQLIRELRELSLAETKDLVDNCPSCILENVTRSEFHTIKNAFEKIGAIVECRDIFDIDVESGIRKTENTMSGISEYDT